MLFPRYVLECVECGVIYRSRQYWFGNDDPVNTVVRTELRHAWPGVRFGCYEKLDMSSLNGGHQETCAVVVAVARELKQ